MKTVKKNTVRSGKSGMTITTTTDTDSGIETTEIESWKGRSRRKMVLERDLATGKLLPPAELKDLPDNNPLRLLAQEMAAVVEEMAKRENK